MPHISITNLSIDFTIYGTSSRSLKNRILDRATGGRVMAGSGEIVQVRALDNVTLDIRSGDRVGLAGHNGSGKTTLLRALAGIFKPSAGRIDIEGTVSAQLDAMAGMEPDSTGVENVYLLGAMLGLSKRFLDARLDEIAAFTELGDFLELPVRSYSAGMKARLAFAVSSVTESEILLIDEGIGAGDAAFQQKARDRIDGLFHATPIVLLATHSDALIRSYCNRLLTLEHGRVLEDERLPDPRTAPLGGAAA
ncbi:MAG: ABC transporter ATP-binding protein [Devosia sp.]